MNVIRYQSFSVKANFVHYSLKAHVSPTNIYSSCTYHHAYFSYMSPRAIQIGEEDIEALTHHVQQTFGHPIKTKKYVYDLIDAIIKQHPKDLISFNTLRRFFKLIPSNHTPTIETLNILCRYCGYSSWDEFTYVANQNSENLLGHSMTQIIRQRWSREHILKMVDQFGKSEKLYHWLTSVFIHLNSEDKVFLINESLSKIISPQNENSALGYAQYFWVQSIGCYLMQLNELEFRRFITQIDHPKIIAELCVNYNTADTNYDILLEHSKANFDSLQDQIFYNSVVFFRHFLRQQSFTKKQIKTIQKWEINPSQIDIKPFSRMRALQIICSTKTYNQTGIIHDDISYFKRNRFLRESVVFYIIEITRALCYIHLSEQAIQVFDYYSQMYKGNIGFWASIHRNTLYLYASWAFALNKDLEKARETFQLFNSNLIENFQEDCIAKDQAIVQKLIKSTS